MALGARIDDCVNCVLVTAPKARLDDRRTDPPTNRPRSMDGWMDEGGKKEMNERTDSWTNDMAGERMDRWLDGRTD